MSSNFDFDPLKVAGSGHFIRVTAGENLTNRQLIYLNADGNYYLADASAAATSPALGIAIGNIALGTSGLALIKGFLGLSTWTWTVGATLYLSDVAGAMGEAAGTLRQEVGHAVLATQIWFDPQNIDTGGAVGAHILATTGPHTNTLPLIDLEVGVQGEVIHRGAADWEALGVGAAGFVLTAGGAGVSVAWAAAAGGVAEQDIFYEAPNPDDFKGTYASMLLTDGQSTLIRQTFYLPSSYDTDWSVDVIVIPDGTGNLRWGVATNFAEICNDEGYQTHTDSIALGQSAVTTDEIECLDITAGLTGALAGDLVGIEFTRDGGDGLDTVDDQVHYIGIVLRAPPAP